MLRIIYMAILLPILVVCSPNNHDSGLDILTVSLPPNAQQWPVTVAEGSISCHIRRLANTSRPMVLFESGSTKYGLNGAASGVGGYTPIRNISDDKVMQFNGPWIFQHWIDAGLSLCNGDRVSAVRAIDSAYKLIAEVTSVYPMGAELTPEELVRRQRIFLAKVSCEDSAYEVMATTGSYPQELEDECVRELLENENTNPEELSEILEQGIFERWPLN